jgi:predicted NAD/FAD-dependent oxidoreductase
VSNPKKVAVIGAGWAGTASALSLHKQGFRVTVFESAHLLGGRARGVQDNIFGMLDNGQHLMLGAYEETLKLIAQLNPNVPEDQLLVREPLYLMSASGDIHLKAKNFWPAPFNNLMGLLAATGLSWVDKISMLGLMVTLVLSKPTQNTQTKRAIQPNLINSAIHSPATKVKDAQPFGEQNLTVLEWLRQQKQSHRVIQNVWQPLCLAMLNTPIEAGCAQLFKTVLRDSLGSSKAGATDIMLPRIDLSALAPQRLVNLLDCRLGKTVRKIVCSEKSIEIDGEHFEGCVIATPPYNTLRLIKECLKHTATYEKLVLELSQFTYAPITTCYMRLSKPFELPVPMLMLKESPDRGHIGQWLFQRQNQKKIQEKNAQACDLAIIMSDSYGLSDEASEVSRLLAHELPKSFLDEALSISTEVMPSAHRKNAHLAQALHQQIAEQFMQRPGYGNQPLPTLKTFRIITEKRATFVARPELNRPSNFTGDARIMLAGDWTDTGYPAVIEGAVRSGLNAARGLFSF